MKMPEVCLFDCVQGSFSSSGNFPYFLGSDPDVDCRIEGAEGKHCQIVNNGSLVISSIAGRLELDGKAVSELVLKEETPYPFVLGSQCYIVIATANSKNWNVSVSNWKWKATRDGQAMGGAMPLAQLLLSLQGNPDASNAVIKPEGLSQGFKYSDMVQSGSGASGGGTVTASNPPSVKSSGVKNAGAHSCPWCWWKFDSADVKWVANHPALKGDPLLGIDAYLRFVPNRFSGHKALDSKGNECSDIACPHCHQVIPVNMLRVPQHLVSIVGDAQSGKSYFLTVMTKVVSDKLASNYDGFFEDATPGANAAVRDMINHLFGAMSLQDGMFLQKTKLDGEMYHKLKRNGEDRQLLLPKPFIFHARSSRSKGCNLVFYDNAGEHFQAGTDSSENPSAQHVASAAGVVFLFDPFNNLDFRRAMMRAPTTDPQFAMKPTGDVVAIMSEMKNRIAKITGSERFKSPVAFIVGKYDAWGSSLVPEGQQFYDPSAEGSLSNYAVQHNSDLTKQILMKNCPAVTRMAESLGEEVVFFPVSSFGAPAVKVELPPAEGAEQGEKMNVPDPATLNPFLVDVPILWLMSKFDPSLVPSH